MKLYQAEMSKSHVRDGVTIKHTTIAWIPEQYADQGKILDLKDQHGAWDGPYEVTRVYRKGAMDGAYVRDHQHIDLPSLKR